ncbi:hypothetical protein [Candidatus Protofrankia californiensis]|uniref:nucleotide-binding protein n=1 Tax=Candidatus Protofrankia californiensis TaxID=1839754 RepID=UPI0019CF91F3|nr:hypothetical protein [Candidatus Protofrankia californiensis]
MGLGTFRRWRRELGRPSPADRPSPSTPQVRHRARHGGPAAGRVGRALRRLVGSMLGYEVDSAALIARRKPWHGDPLARRVGRALRELVGSSVAHEVDQATLVAQRVQQPITTGRRIVVTSIRGGAGKTTVSALLGTAFAHYRHDRALIVEADPGLGTLPVRVGAPAARFPLGDLARIVAPSMPFEQIAEHLVALPDGCWLVPVGQTQVDPVVYQSVAMTLNRYFAITVVDCDTMPSELARTVLAGAHATALVAPATAEGVVTTRKMLTWFHPEALARTVIVLTATAPHVAVNLDEAAARLRVGGASVLTIPYDRHLAAGGKIQASLLAETTRERTTRLAAELLDRAVRR